jgi:sigma-B regulation protein RsbU (phosphoserine phosphatase)
MNGYQELPLTVPAVPAAEPIAVVVRRAEPTWMERDLAAAREVQRRLLPPLEQHWRGVDMLAEYRPAHAVGGDFFHVSTRARGTVVAAVGDVAGKGIAAALIMAGVAGELRRITRRDLGPARALAALNRWLDHQDMADRFVTAACVRLDLARAVWSAACAGHPAPLLVRHDGALHVLGQAGGPGLGLGCVRRWRCDEQEVPARPGDTLLLMTDGITDVLDTEDLAAAVARATSGEGLSWPQLRREIFDVADAIPGHGDDATLLAIRLTSALPDRC